MKTPALLFTTAIVICVSVATPRAAAKISGVIVASAAIAFSVILVAPPSNGTIPTDGRVPRENGYSAGMKRSTPFWIYGPVIFIASEMKNRRDLSPYSTPWKAFESNSRKALKKAVAGFNFIRCITCDTVCGLATLSGSARTTCSFLPDVLALAGRMEYETEPTRPRRKP